MRPRACSAIRTMSSTNATNPSIRQASEAKSIPQLGPLEESITSGSEISTLTSRRAIALPRQLIAEVLQSPNLCELLATAVGRNIQTPGQVCSQPLGADHATLLFCVSGCGWCYLRGRHASVCPGDVLVIPAGQAHSYGAAEKNPWSAYWVHVEGTNVTEQLDALGIDTGGNILRHGNDPNLAALFVELLDVLDESCDKASLTYGANVVRHMLSMMIRRQKEVCRPTEDANQRVAASISYMTRNLAQPIDISQLCRMTGLSPSHYSTLFKRQTGEAPARYLIRMRMQAAAEMLRNTNQEIKVVAARLGYRDPLYFSRVFSGVLGIPPTEYRNRQRRDTSCEL